MNEIKKLLLLKEKIFKINKVIHLYNVSLKNTNFETLVTKFKIYEH